MKRGCLLFCIMLLALTFVGCSDKKENENALSKEEQLKQATVELCKINRRTAQWQEELVRIISSMGSGALSQIEGYEILRGINRELDDLYMSLTSIKNPEELKDIKDAYEYSIVYTNASVRGYIKFLDNTKTSTLVNAQKDFENACTYRQSAVAKLKAKTSELGIDVPEINYLK